MVEAGLSKIPIFQYSILPISFALVTRLFFHFLPSLIGIVLLHRGGNGSGILSQILLKDLAIVVHDESHHSGVSVLRRIRNHGKAADHLSLHQVTVCAAGRVFPLRRENLIVVAMIGRRAAGLLFLVTLTPCPHHDRTERTLGLTLLCFLVQSILFSRIADKFLCVLQETVFIPVFHRIFALGIDNRQQGLNRKQLVLADPAV